MFTGPFQLAHRSIAFNLLKVVFSIYFVVTFFLTGLHMVGEFLNSRAGVLREMKQLASILQGSLAESLWTLDEDQIQSQIRGITLSKTVMGIRIIPVLGSGTWSYGQTIDLPQLIFEIEKDNSKKIPGDMSLDIIDENILAHAFAIQYREADGHKTVLGLGVFYSNDSVVMDKVGLGYVIILINAFVKTVVLWILVLWTGNRYITEPLGRLSGHLMQLRFDDLKEIKAVEEKDKSLELEFLEKSFNRMIEGLKEAKIKGEDLRKDLDKSKLFLIDIIHSMPSVLVVADRAGEIVTWNTQAEHMMRISPKQALGKKVCFAFPQISGCDDLLLEALNEKKPIAKKLVIPGARGQKKHINVIFFPLTRSDAGVVIRLDDMTTQIELDSKVSKTEKMMSLGGLAAGMAHEINNPLGIMLLSAQNIVRRLEPGKDKNEVIAKELGVDLLRMKAYLDKRGIQEMLSQVIIAGDRASRIIYNMLQFSRSTGSKRDLVEIHKVIDTAIDLVHIDVDLHDKIRKNHIAILKDIEHGLPLIPCSISEIEQVFIHLLKNAIQALIIGYTGQVPTIWFRVYRNKAKDIAVIEIEDNGPGMTEPTRKHVFEPFYTTKAVNSGCTGLGLSVCYFIIVEAHGGNIEAESILHKGTKIIIHLPLDPNKELRGTPKQFL